MASSTIVTDLTIHTAHIRLRSGKYMLVYYTNEYDEDGNPINITIYDSSETLIENPPYEIVYEVTKTIPPPEGDWLNNLWFKNGVNSLSPRQSPGQTNNIFLGFETAENFDFTDLVTYSGDYNFLAGYQLAGSLLSGNYNFIFGVDVADPLTTGSNNTLFGYNIAAALTTGNYNLISGYNIAPLVTAPTNNFAQGSSLISQATTLQNNFINGSDIFNASTDVRFSFANGYLLANSVSTTLWYSFFNGNRNADNSANGSYLLINGYGNARNVVNPNFSLISGLSNVGTGASSSVQYSTIIGRDNALAATGSVNHSGIFGQDNLRSGIGIDYGLLVGYRNLYQTTSDIQNTIAIGRENGYSADNHTYSILLGYRQNYTSGGTYRLAIGMGQDDPLISGHFTSDWVRIDGYLEVRDKSGITTGNIVVWDGDKLVDSGSAIGSLGGDPDQTLTWTNTSTTVRDLTISGTGNTVELDGLAVEMALDDIVLNTSWRYQALDVNGVVLGAPLIIQEGTDINIVRSGNTLIFNSTAGGGDPDQTLSYSPTSGLLTISGSGNTVQLDDLVHDSVWSGTSGTISYTMIDVDNLQVGDPLIFNAGTDMGIVRSGNTLTFSYTGSGASLWTDAGTYYRPNNLSNLASNSFRIYDTGRVTIGGTSDPTPYLLSVNGIGRFTSGVSLNGDLEFTNSSDIVFDSGGSGNIVDTNGVSGSSGKFLGHDGGGVAWVDAPGYTPTYATSTGNADTFTTGTYVNINGASTTYTIPVTEVLAVWCSVIILGGSSGANVTVSIRKNSSIILISRTIFVEAGVEKNISLHSNDDFNSGDTLRIHCSTSGSGFETVSTNTTWITVT